MGFYHMSPNRGNTKANHKDPRYIEVFDILRDCEFSVGEAHWVAGDVVNYLDLHPDCPIHDAINEVFKG